MNERTISKDGEFYICLTCYASVRNGRFDKEKRLELLPLIPSSLVDNLTQSCQFKDHLLADESRFGKSDYSRKYIFPNRLEQYLLKLTIPFHRIGFCERGRYLKVNIYESNETQAQLSTD